MRRYDNIELAGRNSFGVAVRAHALVEFASAAELRQLFEEGFFGTEEWYVLGGGNNILFTRDYPGTLLHPTGRAISIIHEDANTVSLRVEAGMEWDELVEWCVERGLWGAENLSLIPGTVGAAPVQNIGAYGADVSGIISSVEAFSTESGEMMTIPAAGCRFGYRDSVFKGELRGVVIITAVNFRLQRAPDPHIGYGDLAREVEALAVKAAVGAAGREPGAAQGGTPGEATLRNIREAVIAIRRRKLPDPAETGNAGSFFKNPVVGVSLYEKLRRDHPDMPAYPSPHEVKLAAAWLIDLCGWKGRREGSVEVHHAQPLVLVNIGGATVEELLSLARRIQADVLAKTGVQLDMEVNVL